MDVVSPKEWGARIDYDQKSWRPWNPDKWVLHYGGGAVSGADDGIDREKRVLRAWERFHIDAKGWLGIAYNYAIGQSGTLYRLRGEQRSGATSGDFEDDGIPENHEARAVVFILGGDQEPSAAALDTFRSMWATDPMPVIGHQQASDTGTSCPGEHLMAFIDTKGYDTMTDVGSQKGVDDIFAKVWQEMLDEGVFSRFTDPDDKPRMEELAAFLSRYTDKVVDEKLAAVSTAPTVSKAQVLAWVREALES